MVLLSLFFVCNCLICFSKGSLPTSNEFDTSNSDECKRVRRSWTSLTTEERQDYIDAMLEIRKNGRGDVLTDELIAIASVHQDSFGEISHVSSGFLFWHSYLLWEMESRIRNLGGKYKCFGMPYWDFSTEYQRNLGEDPFIFDDIVGGTGNPDDSFTVNEYSWDHTVEEYFVPVHCFAKNDKYPYCSLKRSTGTAKEMSSSETGEGIMDNKIFASFTRWYSRSVNLPHNLLTNDESLYFPVVSSYDPIWYLFHSMVTYHQSIWQDCNDYDLIDPNDLDAYPYAYSTFCDTDAFNSNSDVSDCGGMRLDDKMYFGGSLQEKSWSFIHDNDLTIRKSYHLPRWNIIYDLGNGDGFYTESGLNKYCDGKLNSDWFILSINNDNKILETSYMKTSHLSVSYSMAAIGLIGFVLLAIVCTWNKNKKQKLIYHGYGSLNQS